MRLLYLCSALDLEAPFGATPVHWQLLKALSQLGNETIAVPYYGPSVRGLWWRTYPNPTYLEAATYWRLRALFGGRTRSIRSNNRLVPRLARLVVGPQWKTLIEKIFSAERVIDAVIVAGLPLNQIAGIADWVRRRHCTPIIYYDLDAPTSFPRYGGFTFNHYEGADISEYDAFIVPSEGSRSELLSRGAAAVHVMHFGADPEIYALKDLPQDIDVFFQGSSTRGRERMIEMMMSYPSDVLPYKFLIAASEINCRLGHCEVMHPISFDLWCTFAQRSKINLNITRYVQGHTYGTSTSRLFELAAMGCCVVSGPHEGLDRWFAVGEEILMVNSSEESIELYKWLTQDPEARRSLGRKARARVLKEHTFRHRAQAMLAVIRALRN